MFDIKIDRVTQGNVWISKYELPSVYQNRIPNLTRPIKPSGPIENEKFEDLRVVFEKGAGPGYVNRYLGAAANAR